MEEQKIPVKIKYESKLSSMKIEPNYSKPKELEYLDGKTRLFAVQKFSDGSLWLCFLHNHNWITIQEITDFEFKQLGFELK